MKYKDAIFLQNDWLLSLGCFTKIQIESEKEIEETVSSGSHRFILMADFSWDDDNNDDDDNDDDDGLDDDDDASFYKWMVFIKFIFCRFDRDKMERRISGGKAWPETQWSWSSWDAGEARKSDGNGKKEANGSL